MVQQRNSRTVTQPEELLKLNPKWLTQKHEKPLRQKVISLKKEKLLAALKIPPAINQFKTTLAEDKIEKLYNLLSNYLPETKKERKDRLKTNGGKLNKKPLFVKGGAKHVTKLLESDNKVKLVLVAGDVDPIELVLFLPTLCHSKKISYAIVPTQKMLGKFINKKKTTVICVEDVRGEDKSALKNMIKEFDDEFLNNYDFHMQNWGNSNN